MVGVFHENCWYCPQKVKLHEKLGRRCNCQQLTQSNFNRIQRDSKGLDILFQGWMRSLQFQLKQKFRSMFMPTRWGVCNYRGWNKQNKRLSFVHNPIPMLFMCEGDKAGGNLKDLLLWVIWQGRLWKNLPIEQLQCYNRYQASRYR